MSLYKDGKIYRTYEEQVDHLTKKHEEQLNINKNVSEQLQDLGIAVNNGGYNLVRFSFGKRGNFYKFSNDAIKITMLSAEFGDYFEITSGNNLDIPAYGYLNENGFIELSFYGDFTENYSILTFINVTKNISITYDVSLVEFEGTSLLDYNPNTHKKQIFNVIEDITYGGRTQYVSFDLNSDGVYNYVYIGSSYNGKDGTSIYTTNNYTFDTLNNLLKENDCILIASEIPDIPILPDAKNGDIYKFISKDNYEYLGNIKGNDGAQGIQGVQGIQGIQGTQGIQGVQGIQGIQGEKGADGTQGLFIHKDILSNTSELPLFSTAKKGDAYRIINTSGNIVTYDLYFRAEDGDDWAIQPNWGGVPGEKGERGERGADGVQGIQGEQGIQGVQGEQGRRGEKGERGVQGLPGGNNGEFYIINTGKTNIKLNSNEAIKITLLQGDNFSIGVGGTTIQSNIIQSYIYFYNGYLYINYSYIVSNNIVSFATDKRAGAIQIPIFISSLGNSNILLERTKIQIQ